MSHRDLRSIVNGAFAFAVFLIVYALTVPGHASGTSARFLRMRVEEPRHGDSFTFSVPFGLVGGTLRFATSGKVRRELDRSFHSSFEADELKAAWAQLVEKPDQPVTREIGDQDVTFERDGTAVRIVWKDHGDDPDREKVSLRLPARFIESVVSENRRLDVDALLDELRGAGKGDLIDVVDRDTHVRIWIE